MVKIKENTDRFNIRFVHLSWWRSSHFFFRKQWIIYIQSNLY